MCDYYSSYMGEEEEGEEFFTKVAFDTLGHDVALGRCSVQSVGRREHRPLKDQQQFWLRETEAEPRLVYGAAEKHCSLARAPNESINTDGAALKRA